MKNVLPLLTIICLVVPAAGQAADPSATDPTVLALKSLLRLKEQAKFGADLRANHERARFAEFLRATHKQSKSAEVLSALWRFAPLADKKTLLSVKTAADRPNYGGNAAAKTHNNLWLSIFEGKMNLKNSPPAKPKD